MSSRIFDQHGRTVKTHWLIIENRAGERSEILHFEVRRSVSNQRKTRSMGLRKSIECERADVLDDVLLRYCVDAVSCHSSPELAFKILHTLPRAAHPHCATQFLCLCACEVRNRHRHAKELFLKERNA